MASFRRLPLPGLLAALAAAGPAAAQAPRGDGTILCGTPYEVARGDTLSRLSKRAYGDPLLYPLILDANRKALRGDPERLGIGMALTIPCVDVNGKPLTPEAAAEAARSIAAVIKAEGPLTAEELDTLFGPVALFPDAVLTPVLVASTFPIDVVKAARFVDGAADLSDQERAAKAVDQRWDASVRELAAGFPDLVDRMDDNIDWTEQAGEAVVAQTDDVLAAIQRLRATAKENGYLVDNQAQKIEEVNGKIVIAPASPGVVYVPTYDSKVIYSTPVTAPPVYHYGTGYGGYVYHDDDDDWADMLVAGGIILGGAVILDEIFEDDDWNGWDGDDDIDWDRGDITIDRDKVNIDIDRDNVDIGDGDRLTGAGERVSIGDRERIQAERGERVEAPVRAKAAPARAKAAPAKRSSISTPASRDVARQKIETRERTGARPAALPTSPPAGAPSLNRSNGSRQQVGASRSGGQAGASRAGGGRGGASIRGGGSFRGGGGGPIRGGGRGR